MRVGFQGEPGAYSEQAVLAHYGPGVVPVGCRTFAEVFQQAEAGGLDQAKRHHLGGAARRSGRDALALEVQVSD